MKNVYVVSSRNPFNNFWRVENIFESESDADAWATMEETHSELDYFVEEWPILASTM